MLTKISETQIDQLKGPTDFNNIELCFPVNFFKIFQMTAQTFMSFFPRIMHLGLAFGFSKSNLNKII